MGASVEASADDLVSCVMVTRLAADRTAFIRASLAAFQAQTHRRRELVIVVDPTADRTGRSELRAALQVSGPAPIRVVEAPGVLSLGALRNLSLDVSAGAYVCQWDDDDIHHPQRVSAQLAALRAGSHQAVLLQDVLQFFAESRSLYWTNWRATEAAGHPGTLMLARAAAPRYPEAGPEARKGEDLDVARRLRARGALGTLPGAPHLFAYVCHGSNTWDAAHHRMLADRLAISRSLLKRHETVLRQAIGELALGPVVVCGANGPAFEVGGAAGEPQ